MIALAATLPDGARAHGLGRWSWERELAAESVELASANLLMLSALAGVPKSKRPPLVSVPRPAGIRRAGASHPAQRPTMRQRFLAVAAAIGKRG